MKSEAQPWRVVAAPLLALAALAFAAGAPSPARRRRSSS